MNRRTFLCGVTLEALTAPRAAEAQQAGKVYRIGWLDHMAGVASKRTRLQRAVWSANLRAIISSG
jgi:hypothetical protein